MFALAAIPAFSPSARKQPVPGSAEALAMTLWLRGCGRRLLTVMRARLPSSSWPKTRSGNSRLRLACARRDKRVLLPFRRAVPERQPGPQSSEQETGMFTSLSSRRSRLRLESEAGSSPAGRVASPQIRASFARGASRSQRHRCLPFRSVLAPRFRLRYRSKDGAEPWSACRHFL